MLGPVRRVITGHNQHAAAVIQNDEFAVSASVGDGTRLTSLWSTTAYPAEINESSQAKHDTGLDSQQKSSQANVYDIPPGKEVQFHRTITLDYVYVIEGELQLLLDDGSRTSLRAGDFVVQQATMHSWFNEGGSWARVLGIMLPATKPTIGGRQLDTHWPF